MIEIGRRKWTFLHVGTTWKGTPGLGCRALQAKAISLGIDATTVNGSGRSADALGARLATSLPQSSILAVSAIVGEPAGRASVVTRHIRSMRPDIMIVWGGPLSTFYPSTVSRSGLADIVVQGEGEPFIEAAKDGHLDAALSLSHPVLEYQADVVRSLDDLPVISELIDVSSIVYTYDHFGSTVSTYDIQFSRGCWASCTFCYAAKSKYRIRSPSHISRELRGLPDLDFLRIIDDTFPLTEPTVEAIEAWHRDRAGRKRPALFCELRADQIARRPDLVRRLAQVGLREVFVGVETGSEAIRKTLGKPISDTILHQAFATLNENGIRSFAGLLLNFPGQSHQALEDTLGLALRLGLAGYYPAFVQMYAGLPIVPEASALEGPLSELAGQEWLSLDTNRSLDISDHEFVQAQVKLKTVALALVDCPGCPACDGEKGQGRPDCIGAAFVAPAAWQAAADRIASDPRVLPLASVPCLVRACWVRLFSTVGSRGSRTAGLGCLLTHHAYHVRALAAFWVLSTGAAHDHAAALARLLDDPHTFPRVIARLAFGRGAAAHV